MKKMYLMKGMAVLAMCTVAVSCNRLEFSGQPEVSKEDAIANAELQLGAAIDPNQDWNMTKSVTANVSVRMGTGQDYTLLVYDRNPFLYDDAVYYLKQAVSDGANASVNVTVPKARNSFYLALLGSDGISYTQTSLVSDGALTADFTAEGANAPAMRRANNVGDDYPATSTGINANANEWADCSGEKEFGGWLVPDPLTDEQKEVVRKYFQANPGGGYVDPQWRHFFVQQVYTGGTATPSTGNGESTMAADGVNSYTSANMNLLTVGYNEQHINNFNGGSYSGSGMKYKDANGNEVDADVNTDGSVNVLDKGYTVNDFADHHHSDQIMLMVNIDDTECMGYHNSGASIQRNDKAKLVDWTVIRDWANSNGLNGDCLNDGWDRSFVGFDFELLPQDKVYALNEDGTNIYAQLRNVTGNMPVYAWDGEKVMIIGEESASEQGGNKDIINNFTPASWVNQPKWRVERGKVIFNAGPWDTMSASFDGADKYLSSYNKLVLNFESNPAMKVKIGINGKLSDGSTRDVIANDYTLRANHGKLEIDLTSVKNDLTEVNSIYMQAYEAGDFVISQAYLEGSGTQMEHYTSQYILAGTNQIPFYIANTNMYCGETTTITESDMRITKDGLECLNLKKFKDLYDQGFRPVSSDLKTWAKWSGGDNYYSDWIVTLNKAERAPMQETHEEEIPQTPSIWSYAFEDTAVGDYDLNDVVLKAQEDDDNIKLTLAAAGATLDLVIRLYDYDESGENGYGSNYVVLKDNDGNTEIHDILRVERKEMVNTAGNSVNANPYTFTISKSQYDASRLRLAIYSTAQGEVRLSGSGDTPHGVMIPFDWRWPTERTKITQAYNKTDAPETETDQSFTNFMTNAGHAELWYKYPTKNTMKK